MKKSKSFSTLGKILSSCLVGALLIVSESSPTYAISQQAINSMLNNTPFYVPSSSSNACINDISLVGSDNEQKVWNFFKSKNLGNIQIAGIMGNMEQESGFNPEIYQGGGDLSTPPSNPNEGWGIVQWQPGNKIEAEAAQYNITGAYNLLSTQLEVVWADMNGVSPTGTTDMVSGLNLTTSAAAAAQYFDTYFESGGDVANRISFAQQILAQYGGSSTSSGLVAASTTACGASADCNSKDISPGLSTTRDSIVCIAENQLALWESQPGYPYPAYAAKGFLDYSQGLYEEWCADFVSWVYNQAGVPFSGGLNGWGLAGVSEVESEGLHNPNFEWHAEGSGYIPQPGDIAVHYVGAVQHVNIFISNSGGVSTYIGGDQGKPPDGVYGAPNGEVTTIEPSPPSQSNVSIQQGPGYWSDDIIGYVSPKS